MKRTTLVVLLFAALSVSFLLTRGLPGQQLSAGSDQAWRDIEVMKSILAKTLSMAVASHQSEQGPSQEMRHERFRVESEGWVEGFHLKGQGTVFQIHLPGTFLLNEEMYVSLENQLEGLESAEWENPQMLEAQMRLMESQLRLAEHSRQLEEMAVISGEESIPPPPLPPAPPAPPQPAPVPAPGRDEASPSPARKAEFEKQMAETKARIEDLRTELKNARELSGKKREELLKLREAIVDELVGAVARHGDSLIYLKPTEFVNLILLSGDEPVLVWGAGGRESNREILTIQKSDILAYKAGTLSLEAFKSKIARLAP